jgi:hypothetical protein
MRCLSCNCQLNDHEATRKYASSGTFIDLCDHCFTDVEDEIAVIEGQPDNDNERAGGTSDDPERATDL